MLVVHIIQDYTGRPFQLILRETRSMSMFFDINLLLFIRFIGKYSCTNKKIVSIYDFVIKIISTIIPGTTFTRYCKNYKKKKNNRHLFTLILYTSSFRYFLIHITNRHVLILHLSVFLTDHGKRDAQFFLNRDVFKIN